MAQKTAPAWARALWPSLRASTSDEPAPDERHEIVLIARNATAMRHLAPIAAAGGWPLLSKEADRNAMCGALAVCAFVSDEVFALRHGARGTVLCEHGAGQSYMDSNLPTDSPWRGGRGAAKGRLLFLAPGSLIARRHKAAHPQIPVQQIGCPVLDAWHGRIWRRQGPRLRVCISSHWDCPALPETRTSWPWIREHLSPVTACPQIELFGHYHPHEAKCGTLPSRLADYERLGIRVLHSWDEVMETADLFISDNSSTLFEFAATGRPVVCLTPPWYRRSAKHGLRFYRHAPGLQVFQPQALLPAIHEAAADSTLLRQQREGAVLAAYGPLNGRAAERAKAAVETMQSAPRKTELTNNRK